MTFLPLSTGTIFVTALLVCLASGQDDGTALCTIYNQQSAAVKATMANWDCTASTPVAVAYRGLAWAAQEG